MRILLIDNNGHSRKTLKNAFLMNRVVPSAESIKEAISPEEGLELYKSFKPNLVLMEVNFQDYNGLDLCLQFTGIDSECKIIVVSNSKTPGIADEVIRYGAIRFFSKPFQANHIIAYINTLNLKSETIPEDPQELEDELFFIDVIDESFDLEPPTENDVLELDFEDIISDEGFGDGVVVAPIVNDSDKLVEHDEIESPVDLDFIEVPTTETIDKTHVLADLIEPVPVSTDFEVSFDEPLSIETSEISSESAASMDIEHSVGVDFAIEEESTVTHKVILSPEDTAFGLASFEEEIEFEVSTHTNSSAPEASPPQEESGTNEDDLFETSELADFSVPETIEVPSAVHTIVDSSQSESEMAKPPLVDDVFKEVEPEVEMQFETEFEDVSIEDSTLVPPPEETIEIIEVAGSPEGPDGDVVITEEEDDFDLGEEEDDFDLGEPEDDFDLGESDDVQVPEEKSINSTPVSGLQSKHSVQQRKRTILKRVSLDKDLVSEMSKSEHFTVYEKDTKPFSIKPPRTSLVVKESNIPTEEPVLNKANEEIVKVTQVQEEKDNGVISKIKGIFGSMFKKS